MQIAKQINDMSSHKENRYINMRMADNGFVLSWEVYKPHAELDKSSYEEKTVVYQFDQVPDMMKKIMSLYAENLMWKKEEIKDASQASTYESALTSLAPYI